MAPMQNDDMIIGKSCPALTNLHKMALVVLLPSGQCPSAAMYKVNGHVKLQRKKSETDNAKMKAFLGSVRNFLVEKMVQSKNRFRVVPNNMTGM